MDARIFREEPMGLRQELLSIPLEARFAYDPDRNTFFVNMEGLSLHAPADVDALGIEAGKRLAGVTKKVRVAVNYDNFYLAPDLEDAYLSLISSLAERYYESVTRYTTRSFMRLKLGAQLSQRGLAPHIYESHQEALNWLGRKARE